MSISKFIAVLVVIFITTLGQRSLAQGVSKDGDFEVDFIIGCNPLTVNVQNLFGGTVGSVQYIFDNTVDPETCTDYKTNPGNCFNGTLTADTQFTFNDIGTYYIIQILGTATVPRVDYIKIDVLDFSTPPAVTINNCEGNTMEIQFDTAADPYDYYSINFQDGSGNTIDIPNWSGDTNYTYTFSNSGSFGIRIIGFFNNGNSALCSSPDYQITAFQSLPAPEITSLEVENASDILITYEPLAQNLDYELLIDDGSGFLAIGQIDPSMHEDEFLFSDPSLDFTATPYAFQLRVTDNCGSASLNSETAYSIASQLHNEAVNDRFSYDLTWSTFTNDFDQINLIRGTTTLESFSQAQGNTTITHDECSALGEIRFQRITNGITSTGPPMFPFENQTITLPATAPPMAELRGAVVEVTFPSTNFSLGEYIIYRKDIDPDFQEVLRSSSSQYTDTTIPGGTGQVCYRIAYEDECGNISELSDEICLILSTSLGIPNAFSPNGDGMNDIFSVSEGIYNNFRMAVFNRWGTLVFNSTDPSVGWNGQFEGQPANTGTYLYQISFQNADNLLITKTGSFVLIR